MDQVDKEIFKKKLKEIKKYKGRHTELISLFVPNGSDRSTVMNQLTQEINQSSNIKSPTTRKNVQGALKRIIQYLKMTNFRIPETGLVLYSGNVSEVEGRSDIRLFYIVPPRALNVKLYRCDSDFFTDPLDEMLEPDSVYGIVAVDNKEATVAVLSGKKYTILSKQTSTVPGKIKAGGQSAHRFEQLRINAQNDFYARVSERISSNYLPYLDKLKGIVFGGPGYSKNKLVERELIDYRLREKILGYLDVTYTDESGIKEIIDCATDLLRENELQKEQMMIKKFMEAVVKTDLAAYGVDEVIQALQDGRVDTILISEGFIWDLNEYLCLDCEHSFRSSKINPLCDKCNSNNIELIETADPIEYFHELAKKIGAKVAIISRETPEGEQFFTGFGGLGAILRY